MQGCISFITDCRFFCFIISHILFIHITRDPLVVVPSTIRMWDIVAAQNKLKRGWKSPGIVEVSRVLWDYTDHVAACRQKLQNLIAEIRFEDLEKDALKVLKQVYRELGLPWTEDFESAVSTFMRENKNFEKNTYALSQEEKRQIWSICQS